MVICTAEDVFLMMLVNSLGGLVLHPETHRELMSEIVIQEALWHTHSIFLPVKFVHLVNEYSKGVFAT